MINKGTILRTTGTNVFLLKECVNNTKSIKISRDAQLTFISITLSVNDLKLVKCSEGDINNH